MQLRLRAGAVFLLLAAVAAIPSSFAHATAPGFAADRVTMLADWANDGALPDGPSYRAALSGDGSVVAFVSTATNLVAGDGNGVADVFVHDVGDGSTTRVSVASDGTEADAQSGSPSMIWNTPVAISSDGRYVVFESAAQNLVPNDTNSVVDVFEHDRITGTTTRVSVASDGSEANAMSFSVSISDDGQRVGFFSGATNLTSDGVSAGMYVRKVAAGTTELASRAADGSPAPMEPPGILSGDGRHVAFESKAAGIVPGDTNGQYDVFERNLVTGVTQRVSVTSTGRQLTGNDSSDYAPEGPAISAHGRFVAFATAARNLIPDDKDGDTDVFVHDLHTGSTVRANVSTQGVGGGSADYPVMSDDGRYVGFASVDYLLAPCGTNVHGTGYGAFYVRDMRLHRTQRATTDEDGVSVSNYGNFGPITILANLSGDGHVVAFNSDYALETDDTNADFDVYVHDVLAPVGVPDASIQGPEWKPAGAGVCRPSAAFQTRTVHVAAGHEVTFTLRFTNLSDTPDKLVIAGDGGAPGYSVHYRRGSRDATAAIIAGTRRTASLAPGDGTTYTMRIHVAGSAVPGSKFAVLIRCASATRPAVADFVRALVTVS